MSSIVNKIKEAVSSDKHSNSGAHSTTPHNSHAANVADPRIDSDGSHTTGGAYNTHGGNGLTGTHNTTGTSGLTGSHGTHGTHTEGNHGPHDSKLANTVDPRVDSDRDGSKTVGGNAYGSSGTSGLTGSHGTHNNTTGTSGLTGSHGTHGTHTEGNHGPHDSKFANTVDPRVDSDRDGSKTVGGNAYGSSGTSGLTGSHGTHNTTGTSGLTGSHGTHGTHTEGNHGPHDSKFANTVDPRVDSDRDGSKTVGGNAYGSTGTHNTTGTSGLTGTHNTHGEHQNLGRVGGAIGGTHGTGPAPHTAGPHKSDALNKIDPRVDSNLDGSKTLGQDKTYSQSNSTAHKDPTDAAQVPPSVLKRTLGDPLIAHDDETHERERRHSKATHQEQFSGV